VSGRAKVDLKYPDALTTWRVTARAVTGDTKVGTGIARTTTTKDLIVRVITPRFLTEGDEVAVPTIVHNYLPETKTVEVSMKAAGVATAPSAPPEKTTLTIPQNGEQRVDWRFVSNQVGTAAFTATAITDADADAVEMSLPVLPYGLKRQTSQAGSIAGAGEQAVALDVPHTANPARKTIAVALAPSLAGSLLGALDFLTAFPYGCTEQTLSSFLPNIMVTRALAELKIAPTERLRVLDRQVSEGLRRLYDYQHDDGGWGWWKADQNHPFMTAYALYGSGGGEARRIRRRAVSRRQRRDRARGSLQRVSAPCRIRPTWSTCCASCAESQPPRRNRPRTTTIRRRRSTNSGRDAATCRHGRALLLLTLDAARTRAPASSRLILSAKSRRAATCRGGRQRTIPCSRTRSRRASKPQHSPSSAGRARSEESRARTRRALAAAQSQRRLALVEHKQTAMVLRLIDYMKARGELGATFPVDVIVNGQPAGSHTFTAAELIARIRSDHRASAGGRERRQDREERRRALYLVGHRGLLRNEGALTPAGSRQLALVRHFTLTPATVRNRIVYRETAFTGNAAPGDLLLVRLTVAGSNEWRYLMLEDPLPAGTEPIAREDAPRSSGRRGAAGGYGSQREFRDDRAVFFQESFEDGRYEYQYLLKVTTPGVFRAMPARISPMRAGRDRVERAATLTIAAPSGSAGAARSGRAMTGNIAPASGVRLAARIIAWLAIGHAIVGGLLAAPAGPRIHHLMLILSAVFALLIVFTAAIVEGVAIRWWQTALTAGLKACHDEKRIILVAAGLCPAVTDTVAHSFTPAFPHTRSAGFLIASLIFLALYWLTGRFDAWWSAHRGEIDAWLMMRTAPRTRLLHVAVDWLIWFVRYPLALSLAVSFFSAWLQSLVRARPLEWLRAALHWRPLVGLTLALLIFIVLPWRFVYWRPESLPPNWLEPVFVGVKLFAIYVLLNAGWAVVLSAGARQAD
jgi:hypothetical protein